MCNSNHENPLFKISVVCTVKFIFRFFIFLLKHQIFMNLYTSCFVFKIPCSFSVNMYCKLNKLRLFLSETIEFLVLKVIYCYHYSL